MVTSKFAKRSVSRTEAVQFAKYFISGSTYFWSGYIVFAIAYSGFHWAWWPAKMLADAIGWTLNYVAQRYWAFNSESLMHHEFSTAKKYIVLTIFNFGLDYLIVGGLKHLGVTPYIGLFVSAAFFTVWNFAWYRFWVFLRQNPVA
jgi:putative flippase GtrA